jgi:hypothetical protein
MEAKATKVARGFSEVFEILGETPGPPHPAGTAA